MRGIDYLQLEKQAVEALGKWFETNPRYAITDPRDYYLDRIKLGRFFLLSDRKLSKYIADRFDLDTDVLEVGSGYGELGLLLASEGFRVRGYEGAAARHLGALAILQRLSDTSPELAARVAWRKGLFPADATADLDNGKTKRRLLVATNVTHSYLVDNLKLVLDCLPKFQDVILDVSRFGRVWDAPGQVDLIKEIQSRGFQSVETLLARHDQHVIHFRYKPPSARRVESFALRALRCLDPRRRRGSRGVANMEPHSRVPFYMFHSKHIRLAEFFPTIGTKANGYVQQFKLRVQSFNPAGGVGNPGEGIRVNPDESFTFPEWGPYYFRCDLGTVKCLLLDPEQSLDDQAIALMSFLASNVVHSWADYHLLVPDQMRSREIVMGPVLSKLFKSDQPIALHCEAASDLAAAVARLNGFEARRVGIPKNPLDSGGHVVSELFLPGLNSWVLFDIDWACMISDEAGRPLSFRHGCERRRAGKQIAIRTFFTKKWLREEYNFCPLYDGQFSWSPELNKPDPLRAIDWYAGLFDQDPTHAEYYSEVDGRITRVDESAAPSGQQAYHGVRRETSTGGVLPLKGHPGRTPPDAAQPNLR